MQNQAKPCYRQQSQGVFNFPYENMQTNWYKRKYFLNVYSFLMSVLNVISAFKYVLDPLFSYKLLKAKKDFLESRVVNQKPRGCSKALFASSHLPRGCGKCDKLMPVKIHNSEEGKNIWGLKEIHFYQEHFYNYICVIVEQ